MRATQTATGTILVHDEPLPGDQKVALYARVSSADQKADLERQVERLKDFAAARGLQVVCIQKEIGSGLNGSRLKLIELLSQPNIHAIVVEHRDRLCRFEFDYIDAALRAHGRELIVMNDTEVADDPVRNMVEVLTSFCARLYGRRSARRRAEAALEAAKEA